jgi:SpoVK/Ycf46/Vps4 family AAA+-type ATPase
LAQIYRELGLLTKGHLVETDRSGLIAEYAGQTAVKVNKVVDEALDGVLFIDEAYALVGQNKDDYGKEAVATLIKRMEDDRSRLIVVLAGYSNEMEVFIETNPGFKSRINRYIDFRDYSTEEMVGIFKLFLKQSQYNLNIEAESKAQSIFESAYLNRDKSFGNGRFVRNVFEKCLENQANRLATLRDIDRKSLMQIEVADISAN